MTLTDLYLYSAIILFACCVLLAIWLVVESRACNTALKQRDSARHEVAKLLNDLGAARNEANCYKQDAEAWKKAHDLLLTKADAKPLKRIRAGVKAR